MRRDTKYIAIKVKGFDHWIWFENQAVQEKDGMFNGSDGWGKGGAETSIEVPTSEIVARIYSNELQYGD